MAVASSVELLLLGPFALVGGTFGHHTPHVRGIRLQSGQCAGGLFKSLHLRPAGVRTLAVAQVPAQVPGIGGPAQGGGGGAHSRHGQIARRLADLLVGGGEDPGFRPQAVQAVVLGTLQLQFIRGIGR